MKTMIELCVLGAILIGAAGSQKPARPALRKGVSVQMPVAAHAVEVRAADQPDSTVVAITAAGKIYSGIEPVEPAALGSLTASTVYLKADSRVPFQTVLTVLDALRGKQVVLLAASPAKPDAAGTLWPYGIKVSVPR